MHKGRVLVLSMLGALAVVVSATVAGAAIQNVKPYAVGLPGTGYETKRLLSVGDTVPETSNPAKQFQMIGIPDGLGAHRGPNGTRVIYMNHELTGSTTSEPVLGDPLNRGAFVSKLIVDRKGKVLSGERAYDTVYNENVLVGPAAEVGNGTRAFSRFCSGDLAGPEHGFDTHIYLTNEEEGTPANTFDTKGGLAVAIVSNNLYTLPKLGRFAWENSVTQPGRSSSRTVIMSMEDGPSDLESDKENSQVYMYVGTKVRPHSSVLRRNGLDNGKLYVLAPVNSAQSSEAAFANGTIAVKWVEIVGADLMTEGELETATDTAGGIRFARPEDGAFNDRNRNEYFFVTTGSNGAAVGALGNPNNLGRLYSLRIDRNDPTAAGTLTVVVNADQVIAAGGDTAISPDNIDVSDDYLMINEDGTGTPAGSRQVMTAKNRDGSIWRFKLRGGSVGVDGSSAKRVAELDPPGRDGVAVLPGIWETSGIVDGDDLYGDGSWIFDVQAHPPTAAAAANTVEDGQLMLLTRSDDDDDDDDEDDEDDD